MATVPRPLARLMAKVPPSPPPIRPVAFASTLPTVAAVAIDAVVVASGAAAGVLLGVFEPKVLQRCPMGLWLTLTLTPKSLRRTNVSDSEFDALPPRGWTEALVPEALVPCCNVCTPREQ